MLSKLDFRSKSLLVLQQSLKCLQCEHRPLTSFSTLLMGVGRRRLSTHGVAVYGRSQQSSDSSNRVHSDGAELSRGASRKHTGWKPRTAHRSTAHGAGLRESGSWPSHRRFLTSAGQLKLSLHATGRRQQLAKAFLDHERSGEVLTHPQPLLHRPI